MFEKRLPPKLVKYPASEAKGEKVDYICDPAEGCGETYHAYVDSENQETRKDSHEAKCLCGKPLKLYWGEYFSFGFQMKGPGFHETKSGKRIKADRERRSKKLQETQWDQHQPVPLAEGVVPRNPTKGGPYDPNSKRFIGKKKKNTVVSLPPKKSE